MNRISKMNTTIPTIGRMVIYHTTEAERKALSVLGCNNSTTLPAVIVATWGDTPESAVNVKVFVDGNHPDLWRTSISVSEADADGNYREGSYSWPVRQ